MYNKAPQARFLPSILGISPSLKSFRLGLFDSAIICPLDSSCSGISSNRINSDRHVHPKLQRIALKYSADLSFNLTEGKKNWEISVTLSFQQSPINLVDAALLLTRRGKRVLGMIVDPSLPLQGC
jgi:hypothetical protein